MSEHTKEPWAIHPLMARIVPEDHISRPIGADDDAEVDAATYAQEICAMHWPDRNRSEEEVFANARRIVACVNACMDIPQQGLEAGMTMAGLLMELAQAQEQRNKLLAVINKHFEIYPDDCTQAIAEVIAEIEASK